MGTRCSAAGTYFDGNGQWDTDWSSSPLSNRSRNDDWAGTVRLEVTDFLLDTSNVTVHGAHPRDALK